jgi:RNA polymerase sigma-70 factor, ECF subfamily
VAEAADEFDELLAAAQAGEEWALATLYRDLHPALVRYLHGHAPAEAEDLAADVWIEVAQSLVRFSGGASEFRRFAFTIARRRAIDYGRKTARRRTEPMDVASATTLADQADPEATALDAMTSAAAVERIRALLPAEQADVILLRVIAGLSLQEVAQMLGKRPGAVSVLQHRALRRLASRLGGEDAQ